MKILIAGNLANMGYEIALAMRKKNVDVKLLLPTSPIISEDPKILYPQLENEGYPTWLVWFNKKKKGINNWKFEIIKEMRKNEYDMIITLAEFSIFALFSGKPYAVLSTGSDLRELFFEKSLKGMLFRLAYKKARGIIWGEPDKFALINRLGFMKKSFFATAPRQFNTNLEKIENNEFVKRFVIFSPTAQDWRLKGNDKLLYAFKRLCEVRNDVFLIVSERGPNVNDAKNILSAKNTIGKFKFLPYLNSNQLQYYYNLSDVVSDQFQIGSIGMITIEAMRYGKPVLIKLNEESFRKCYNDISPGMINVSSENDIFNWLNRLATETKFRKELGELNKRWIEKNWDYDKLTERYIFICNKICNKVK